MYKYSDRNIKIMKDLLEVALNARDSGLAALAGREDAICAQIESLNSRLAEAVAERAAETENQSEDQTENQSEDQSDDQTEDQAYLNVQTVYQLARLDISFGFALRKLACIAIYPDFTPDPLDQLAFADGMLFGSLYALCFHSGHGQKTLHADTFRVLRAQIARLHDLVLARIEV